MSGLRPRRRSALLAAAAACAFLVASGPSHAQAEGGAEAGSIPPVSVDPEPAGPGAEAAAPAAEAPGGAPTAAESGSTELNLLELLQHGGLIGYAILVLSAVMVALAVRFAIELRLGRLAPPALGSETEALLRSGDVEGARARLAQSESLLAAITDAGLAEFRFGRSDVATAISGAADHGLARLARRIEYLNVIATVAPMLGLLGTVVGMVRTFATIASSPGPVEPSALAGGIFQALVTTVLGLSVAIPAVLLFSILRNRADELGSETILRAEELVGQVDEASLTRSRRAGAV